MIGWDADDLGSEEEGFRPGDDVSDETPEDASFYRRPPLAIDRRSPRQLWLISYSDFMTILMIFFLAMYGYAHLAKTALLERQRRTYGSEELAALIGKIKTDMGDAVHVRQDTERLTIEVGEKILFPTGSVQISSIAAQAIDDVARTLKLVPGDVIVEGHTDSVPVAGGHFRSNWELSVGRSFSVIQALSARGIDPKRLAAWGFGENRPKASNATADGRAQNRRIEIVVLKNKGAA